MLEISSGIFTVPETSLEEFSRCLILLLQIFTVLETSGDFHGAEDFFEWIFMVLETSSGIFTAFETSLEDFHGAGDFIWRFLWRIFTVLETS